MTALTPTAILADPAVFRARTIGDDVAIYLSDAEILVSSTSKPGSYRLVNILENTCTCEAATLGGYDHCHHRATARTAAEIERREAVPVQPELCACGRSPWTIKIEGVKFCAQCAPHGLPKGFVR